MGVINAKSKESRPVVQEDPLPMIVDLDNIDSEYKDQEDEEN